MKKLLFFLVFFTVAISNAQKFDFTIDHTTLIVNDLKTTGDFYQTVIGLKEIDHPTKDPGFRWFSIQGNTQLHLIYKENVVMKKHKSSHVCLSTSQLDAFIKNLVENKIPYEDWPGTKGAVTLRADGIKQIYITDPEGYWIEINDAKH
ncbi:Glyoxalase/bleomycin resistance protein/dioxygenase [Cellulophaga algicola DSM 14237]|uniref:Glyoxalase/bleomycin resistance protein/dioxygenase n=1 Tax=Cellulophaga algicola (strain DSM 14237 / IC166 / ACAM 630) TaxID=688270 RepID=E6X661_CELAD|nr:MULTISPECIES: VOC family protein [Cellulophaga]ADV50620.1 Glyoxalase/bleomycin resistance protein/dioxygenase [Cellulophaga algicola DSM 14237]